MPAKSLLMLALFLAIPISVDAQMDPLLQLLQHKHCARCKLNDADLVHADLRGSILYGTDLRSADLSGAQLDQGALEKAHWQGTRGVAQGSRSHAGLHNAGVDAAQAGR